MPFKASDTLKWQNYSMLTQISEITTTIFFFNQMFTEDHQSATLSISWSVFISSLSVFVFSCDLCASLISLFNQFLIWQTGFPSMHHKSPWIFKELYKLAIILITHHLQTHTHTQKKNYYITPDTLVKLLQSCLTPKILLVPIYPEVSVKCLCC